MTAEVNKETGEYSFLDPAGRPVWVKPDEVQRALQSGYQPESPDHRYSRERMAAYEEKYGNKGLAMLSGGLEGATLGFYNKELQPEALRRAAEIDPGYAMGGDLLTSAGMMLIPGAGGARIAGAGAKVGTKVASSLGGKALGKAAGALARGGIEGGLYAGATSVATGAGNVAAGHSIDEQVDHLYKDVATGGAISAGANLALLGVGGMGRFVSKNMRKGFDKYVEKQTSVLRGRQTANKDVLGWTKRANVIDDEINKIQSSIGAGKLSTKKAKQVEKLIAEREKIATRVERKMAEVGPFPARQQAMKQTQLGKDQAKLFLAERDVVEELGTKAYNKKFGQKIKELNKLKSEARDLKGRIERTRANFGKEVGETEMAMERKLVELEQQLADRAQRLAGEGVAKRATNFMASGALSGALGAAGYSALGPIGGSIGYKAGQLIGNKAMNAVANFIKPIGASLSTNKGLAAAGRVAKSVGKNVPVTAKAMTIKEFNDIRRDMKENTPEDIFNRTMASMPQGTDPMVAQKMAIQNTESFSLIKEEMDKAGAQLDLGEHDIPEKAQPLPTTDKLRRLTRVLQTIADPESAVAKLSKGNLFPEEAKVLNRIYHEEMEPIKEAVRAEIRAAQLRNERFNANQTQQMRLVLGESQKKGLGKLNNLRHKVTRANDDNQQQPGPSPSSSMRKSKASQQMASGSLGTQARIG